MIAPFPNFVRRNDAPDVIFALRNVRRRLIFPAIWRDSANTKAVAEEIHAQVGGDIFHVTTVKTYPEDYRQTTEVAKVEQNNNERPALNVYVENMDEYDTLFVGFPDWWGSMPMAMFTFLEHYDLSGKTVVPFLTHGGGGVQRCEQDIAKVCSSSTVLPALVLSASQGGSSKEQVSSWLRRINLAK